MKESVQGLVERAEALLEARQIAAATAAFVDAQRCGADPNRCSGGLWMTSMFAGDFAGAWQQSDVLRQRDAVDPHRLWNGESLQGKRVIVRCLHGFGDAVQMLRYAPCLARVAEAVVFEVAPRFVPLALAFDWVWNVVTWGDDAPAKPSAWDVQIEIMELPYFFRTTESDLPVARNYVHLPAALLENVGDLMGRAFAPRIGVVWAGGEWNAARSVPFAMLAALLLIDGVEFWNLQGGAQAREASGYTMRDATAVCGEGLRAFAATIAQLDLVITVDTLAAHLAGAMGKPVWLMLQYAGDWRWMDGRAESPWYPSMRIFRQAQPGDWQSVVDDVREAMVSRWTK